VRGTYSVQLHGSLLEVGRGGDVRVARAAVGERGRRGDGRPPALFIIIINIIEFALDVTANSYTIIYARTAHVIRTQI